MTYGQEVGQAARIAAEAGELLLDLRAGLARGQDVQALRDEADRRAHEHIVRALATAFPRDAVLSEEGADDPHRLDAARVWVVDPLDGTREFGEAGRSDWAVHVGLVVDHVAVAGAVALPGAGVLLHSGGGHRLEPLPAAARVVVSRTRPPTVAEQVAVALDGELVAMGSAGAKIVAVVRGHAEVYVHAGGQYEWDSAAPVAVAAAHGLHCSRLDGSPLRYNQPNPYLPDLVVCRPELAQRVLEVLA